MQAAKWDWNAKCEMGVANFSLGKSIGFDETNTFTYLA